MGAKSKIAILRVLLGSKLGHSGSGIAKRAGIGLLAIQNALADLEKLGLVEVARGAVEHRYRLNFDHYLVKHGLRALFDGERSMVKMLASDLRRLLEGKVLSAGLFGSFVREEARTDSDIDLLVIVGTLKDHQRVSGLLAEASPVFSQRYGLPIQPIVIDRQRLASQRSANQDLLDSIERDWLHITGTNLRILRQQTKLLKQTRRRKSA
ncbi:MAG: nucleotidyltransferase domain-containing protein [Pyrinomonadaceae bacterium]